MNVTAWAIRNLKPILFITAVLCAAGAFIYSTFPVSILPDVTFPRVVIIAEAGDRPTKTVEVTMARPIEEAVATAPNVQRIRAKTKPGSTEISVDFTPGTDIVLAEQMINAKVNEVRPQLPADATTEVERMNATVFPVLGLTLKSKTLTPTELWNLATYNLKPRLTRVPGVSRLIVQGGRPPEIAVELKVGAMAELGLAPTDVVNALASGNVIRSIGVVDRQYQRFRVSVDGEAHSVDDVRVIVVGQKNGAPIRLSQVAEVRSTGQDRTTIVSANGAESVLINVIRQPTANTVSMIEGVRAEIERLKPSLPKDVEIATFYDQSILIREAIGSVREAVLIGSALSVLILLMFLRDLRATLVTAAIIPVTLLIAFVLMRMSGMTLNLMTLGALAVGIGLVIDDAIVVVEAVFHNYPTTPTIADAVRAASSQIAAPMISSTLTTVVVFVPLVFLSGVSGAFFSALAVTLTIALMVSLGLALAVSPSLCAAFLRHSSDHGHGRFVLAGVRGYQSLLKGCLQRKWIVFPVIAAIVGGTYAIQSGLKTGFMPAMDEGAFVLDYWTPPGTSLDESDRLLKKIDAILMEVPEVDKFSRRTGTELGFAITESNRGDYAVTLKSKRKRGIEEIMDDVRGDIQSTIPGVDVEFVQVLQDLINDLAGSPNPIEVKLFGENKAASEKIAAELVEKMNKINGLVDVKSESAESGPEVRFEVDPGEAGRRGMTSDAIAAQASASLIGTVATQILQGDRQIPVRVRLPERARLDLPTIERIGIQTPVGRVPLGQLAHARLVPGTTQSNREDQRRVVSVVAGLKQDLDLGTAVARVRKILAETKLPPGVTAVIAGQYKSQQDSFVNLAVVLGAAVLLVFTVMLFQFRSFVAPGVILLLMPLSLFGAVACLYWTKTALNVSSFMGVIMLAGIVVKNGILLLDRAQHAIESGATPDEAILEAGAVRLRPILMTTATAILGLAPLALGLGAGAEMQKPLAIVVVGGLTFSTVLTLVIGPVLYAGLMNRRRR